VSARSALTEGSDRVAFVLIHPKCSWAQEPCKECAGRVKFRVANLSEELKDCCCRCAQSRKDSTLEVFEGCRKECVQESFLKDSELGKLRKDIGLQIIEGSTGKFVP
jgi:hypothetical protein